MNSIYDFKEIEKISKLQRKLILGYIFSLLCFAGVLVSVCFFVENNVLLTIVFALLLLLFFFSSIVFRKIKYGILKEYKLFLDNMEMGMKKDYIGSFVCKESAKDDTPFDSYVFTFSNEKTSFLIHKGYSVNFKEGKKYHMECVGNYVYRWEITP